MKKIFFLCLAGALCLAAASCDDDKDNDSGFSGKMTVNGQTETVKCAFYDEEPGNDSAEAQVRIAFLKDVYAEFPDMQPQTRPTIMVLIGLSESLFGKTIDLTQPLDQHTQPVPALMYGAIRKGDTTSGVNYLDNKIYTNGRVSITTGTLRMTRDGDCFTVIFFVKFSDGSMIAANCKGRAKQTELPSM